METSTSAALARLIRTETRPKSKAPTALSRGDLYPAARSASARILHPWSRCPRKLTKCGKLGGNFVFGRECKAHYVFYYHDVPYYFTHWRKFAQAFFQAEFQRDSDPSLQPTPFLQLERACRYARAKLLSPRRRVFLVPGTMLDAAHNLVCGC